MFSFTVLGKYLFILYLINICFQIEMYTAGPRTHDLQSQYD